VETILNDKETLYWELTNKMGIIKGGTMELGGKIVRVKLFGYEEAGKFIVKESYVNETDLVNIGLIKSKLNWDDVISEDSE